MDGWEQIVRQFGVPGAMAVAIVVGFMKGMLVPAWVVRHEREEATRERVANELRLQSMKDEKDYWRELTMGLKGMAEKSTETANRATALLEKK